MAQNFGTNNHKDANRANEICFWIYFPASLQVETAEVSKFVDEGAVLLFQQGKSHL